MAKIKRKMKWDDCVHALCPFGRGFALCSYDIKLTDKLKVTDFPICMDNGKCPMEQAKKDKEVKKNDEKKSY